MKSYGEKSISETEKAIQLQSSNGRMYQYKGGLHLKFNQYNEARDAFKKAHTLGSKDEAATQLGLGRAYVELQDTYKAQKTLGQFAEKASICSRYMSGVAFTLALLEFEKYSGGRRLDPSNQEDIRTIKRIAGDDATVARKAAEWYRQGLASVKKRDDTIDHYGLAQKRKARRLMQILTSENVDGLRSLPRDYFTGENPWQFSIEK